MIDRIDKDAHIGTMSKEKFHISIRNKDKHIINCAPASLARL